MSFRAGGTGGGLASPTSRAAPTSSPSVADPRLGATTPANSFVSTITIQDDAKLVALQQAMYDALDVVSEMWGVQL
jgi:hypothetical protein